jgi:hypothetical protein
VVASWSPVAPIRCWLFSFVLASTGGVLINAILILIYLPLLFLQSEMAKCVAKKQKMFHRFGNAMLCFNFASYIHSACYCVDAW